MIAQAERQNLDEIIKLLRPFAKIENKLSVWQSFSTLFFVWSSVAISFWAYSENPFVLLISVPITIIFMCRSFAIEHDCGHQNLFASKNLNTVIGTMLGFGIGIPYQMWKLIHDSHHQHLGNLTNRSLNPEVWTMTVNEFNEAPKIKQGAYRFMRSKFARLIMTPVINYGIIFRLVHPKFNAAAKISVLVHDIIYLGLVWFALSCVPMLHLFVAFFSPLILFYCVAAFTVYIQHQFEDTYWNYDGNWDYLEASFYGASLVDAPRWFKWLTGYIVYHNIHHLVSKIPNYKLEQAKLALEREFNCRTYTLKQACGMFNFQVWDEERGKLVKIS